MNKWRGTSCCFESRRGMSWQPKLERLEQKHRRIEQRNPFQHGQLGAVWNAFCFCAILYQFSRNSVTILTAPWLAAAEQVEQARQILVERMKESKTLNRLREKEWLAYCQELLKEEQKQIDEVATTRYLRKNADLEE